MFAQLQGRSHSPCLGPQMPYLCGVAHSWRAHQQPASRGGGSDGIWMWAAREPESTTCSLGALGLLRGSPHLTLQEGSRSPCRGSPHQTLREGSWSPCKDSPHLTLWEGLRSPCRGSPHLTLWGHGHLAGAALTPELMEQVMVTVLV